MWPNNPIFDYEREPSRDILCLDCKSFYASVEAVDLGLNPLTTKLVVMSYPFGPGKKRGSGLILASSPAANKAYHIPNVARARDLPYPYPKDLHIVPPRMRYYMEKNREINRIYQSYVDTENHSVYSIDESFLDVTDSLRLFKARTADELAQRIQAEVLEKTGIYITAGIGDNPLLAKLALDNAAKKAPHLRAEWRYEDIPNTLWQIPRLTDMWGIGRRTARKLQGLGINTPYDLAHTNYFLLKDKFGVKGEQMYASSRGIDRSFLGQKYRTHDRSLGHHQVLPYDYSDPAELRLVIREMADQVATRLRRKQVTAQKLSLSLGYSQGYRDQQGRRYLCIETRIEPTQATKMLTQVLLQLFQDTYDGQLVRHLGVTASQLTPMVGMQMNLLIEPKMQLRQQKLDTVVDEIRQRYGFKSLIRTSSLQKGGRAVERSQLVGGHAGGLAGMENQGHGKAYKKRIQRL